MYTLQNGIDQALAEAEKKLNNNKLFKPNDDSPESFNFENGDPETLYSIASYIAQYVEDKKFDEALDEIENALIKKYPNFI